MVKTQHRFQVWWLYLDHKHYNMAKTKQMILDRLRMAKEKMKCWELTVQEYNKYVRHCRKLLNLLATKWLE